MQRKRNLYHKSRYYKQRQRKRKRIYAAAGAILLLFVFLAAVQAVKSQKKQAVFSSDSKVQDNQVQSDTDLRDSNGENENSDESSSSADSESPDSSSGTSDSSYSSITQPVTLTVSVVGDCTLGTDENFDYSTSLNAYFENYGKEYFLQNVKGIFEADDLTIANNEGTFTDSDQRADKLYAFKAPASFADIYSSSSVEAVNTANNHSHDYGEDSFTDTMAALDAEGIVHFGYEETAVMEIKRIKVGLVGIYELNDHLGCEQQLKDNISKVKEEGAQLVIVIFHWGNEKETVPDSNQTTLGRLAIDEGADLVCGHHPHVLQGIEEYKGKNILLWRQLCPQRYGYHDLPADLHHHKGRSKRGQCINYHPLLHFLCLRL